MKKQNTKTATSKKKELNPANTTWGKVLVVVLCFAMIAAVILGFVIGIINAL